MMLKTTNRLRREAARLSLVFIGCGLLAMPIVAAPQLGLAAASGSAATAVAERTPEETVRQFYDWYLGELRAGREPSADDAGLRNYLTDEHIREFRKQHLEMVRLRTPDTPVFDPVLSLKEPRSDWVGMKVYVGKAESYPDGYYDSYVLVEYGDYTDSHEQIWHGTRFIGIDPKASIGLNKTPAGWKIASIGAAD
jgi:hypothetical protein